MASSKKERQKQGKQQEHQEGVLGDLEDSCLKMLLLSPILSGNREVRQKPPKKARRKKVAVS